jgi:hypothetical protein
MRESLPPLPFRQPGRFLSVATLRDLCWLIIGLGVIVFLALKFLVPYLILRDSLLLLDALGLIMCLLFIYLTEGLQQAASLIHNADDDSLADVARLSSSSSTAAEEVTGRLSFYKTIKSSYYPCPVSAGSLNVLDPRLALR